MNPRLDRLYDLLSGLLFIVGTLVFLNGGRQHPRINSSLGPPGSVEYFRNFSGHVLHHHDWEGIHAQILAGPVLWALGAVALAERRRRAGESRWSALGLTAHLLGAGCWIVAFVFDGFVAPQIARTLAADEGPLSPAYLSEFAANAAVVIRAGLVSWLLVGLSAAAFGASLAVERRAGMFHSRPVHQPALEPDRDRDRAVVPARRDLGDGAGARRRIRRRLRRLRAMLCSIRLGVAPQS